MNWTSFLPHRRSLPAASAGWPACACALLFNNLLRHHRYPHVAHAAPLPPAGRATAVPLPLARVGFMRADLDAVIQDYD